MDWDDTQAESFDSSEIIFQRKTQRRYRYCVFCPPYASFDEITPYKAKIYAKINKFLKKPLKTLVISILHLDYIGSRVCNIVMYYEVFYGIRKTQR